MNGENFILFAAPGIQEIFSILVAIVFFVVWLVNQIADAKKQQREKEQAQPEAPPDPMAAGAAPAAAQPKAPPQDPLRAQVDEFLRRAGKQPGGKPPAPPSQRKPPARDEIVVLLDDSVAEPPRRSPSALRPQSKPAVPAARDKRSPAPPASKRPASRQRGKSVAEHVAEHTGSSTTQFRQEVADLGQRVKQADEQFDWQLQQKFDHELGTLASRAPVSEPPPQAAAPVSPAAQIAALMASPDGVRQAIVLNEVLRRPTDRW